MPTLYLVAKGGGPTPGKRGRQPRDRACAVLGEPPAKVSINEFTTVASVWTHNQFIDGTAIKGNALQLKIAGRQRTELCRSATGGWGATIQDPLNSGQTPTMANFATLADALAGCVTRVTPDACSKLYAARGAAQRAPPTDTLDRGGGDSAYPWYQPERVFALLDTFYPDPQARPCVRCRTCRTCVSASAGCFR